MFTFVTDGVASAIEQAQAVAGNKLVSLFGATVMQQALPLGLVDENRGTRGPCAPRCWDSTVQCARQVDHAAPHRCDGDPGGNPPEVSGRAVIRDRDGVNVTKVVAQAMMSLDG